MTAAKTRPEATAKMAELIRGKEVQCVQVGGGTPWGAGNLSDGIFRIGRPHGFTFEHRE